MAAILTFLLFAIPLARIAIKEKTFKEINFPKIVMTINLALIVQVLIGLVFAVTMPLIDKSYSTNQSNSFTDLWMDSGIYYLVIGAFFYLPAVLILNISNWIKRRQKNAKR